MKKAIYNFLTDHIKWVFSGIGISLISFIITCSNGAEDKNHTVINIPGNHSGTITGNNEGTINSTNNVAETIKHEEYKDNSRKVDIQSGRDTYYTEEGDIIQKPSYRDATIVRGDNGNPVGVTDNPDVFNNAIKLLTRVASGENVDIKEAVNTTHPKFLINSGTEIAVLEYTGTGFAEFAKVKILEGTHKDEIGWIHASTIQREQRQE